MNNYIYFQKYTQDIPFKTASQSSANHANSNASTLSKQIELLHIDYLKDTYGKTEVLSCGDSLLSLLLLVRMVVMLAEDVLLRLPSTL